jgi:hypothetical protein
MPPVLREHAVELALPPERALAVLERTAEAWGAEFEREGEGGALLLPVVAGLRRGFLRGRVSVTRAPGGARLVFAVGESAYRLHRTAVVILVLALTGAVATVLWPFFPRLLVLAPVGLALGLGAWLLVVSKLTNSGAEEFLAEVAAEGGGAGAAGLESPGM